MLKNYLKIALRNIKRHKGYSFINIVGLAIGMACCILILLWVQDELSYDRFHENADDIYRVIQDINFADHSTTWTITQGPLGPSLKEDFPEIINATRITDRGFRLTYDDKGYDEEVGMADGSLFEMFTFPLVKGDPATALSDPFCIVLTEEMAAKYFGDEDPIGKTIKANNQWDFQVTGVMKNVPHNSHLQFDFLIPFIFGRELNYTVDRWGNSQFRTYVQLPKGALAQDVISKISGYLFEKPTIEKDARLNLQPLTRIHLYSNYEFDSAHGDITYVTLFSLIAFFILLIACINFMNLATARSGNRAKEVGMRKVAGAHKIDIIRQFYGESILLASIALLLAVVLVWLLLPVFNNLAAKELSLDIPGNLSILLGYRKLGYDKEYMIYFGMRGDTREKFDSVKNELLQNPNILGVTASSNVPTYGYTFSNSLWRWEGQNPDEEILMRAVFIDIDYLKSFGMEIAEGRSFSKEFPTDATEAIMVNEEAVKVMGMESPVGKRLSLQDQNFKIIGVVKNYHFMPLRQEIDPLILLYYPQYCGVLFARLKSDHIPQTIGYIEDVCKKFAPGYPFNYHFLDEALDRLYRSEQRIGTLFRYFSILAILISCLGLLGLASFMAEQRTKEIGIRKVLGATASNIVALLSKEFTKWVIVANIFAWPIAYFALSKWLQSYAYKTNIALLSFVLSGALALLIALATVSYQSIKAALANPVDSLRYE